MKIGVNARTFSVDDPGGAVQTAKKITHKLIQDKSLEVILFGYKSIQSEFKNTTVDSSYYIADSQLFGVLWERFFLPHLAEEHKIDILFCPNGNGPLTNQPFGVVLFIHDVNAQKGLSSGIHKMYRRVTVPPAAQIADTIMTVSEFSRGEIQETIKVPPEKIAVIYNGIDNSYFEANNGDPIELPENYILFVGSLNPRKNIEGVIDSYHQFRRQSDLEYKLVLIGPKNRSIFKKVDIKNFKDVILSGFVTLEELKYAYANADVFVFPSFYEGFGLPALEAMACGVPVIASDIDVHKEILSNSAYYVNPHSNDDIAEAYETVLTTPSIQKELAAKGREQAKKFTWDASVMQLKDVFSQVAKCTDN